MSFHIRRLIWIVVCFAATALAGRPALAQTRQMQIELDSSTPAARSLAPVLLVWKVTSQSSNLIEGHFEITVTDDHEMLAQVATEDLVLSAGQQTIRTLLPPLDSITYFPELTLHVRFIGKRERLDLGKHLIRVPPISQRGLVVGVSNPWQSAASPALDALLQQMRLEKMVPEPAEGRGSTLNTTTSRLLSADLPQIALSYCVFDLLLLPEDGFATLRSQQLAAILDWVRSGGSVCVVPGKLVLSPAHVDFLNALSGTTSDIPPYLLDSTGHLMPPDDVADDGPSPKSYRVGLGRAVVALGRPEQAVTWWDSAAWREAVAFLWKVRHDQVATLTGNPTTKKNSGATGSLPARASPEPDDDAAGGQAASATPQQQVQQVDVRTLPPGAFAAQPVQVYMADDYNKFMQWAPIPIHTVDQLLLKLMPASMRIMPLSLMMLMLGLYVLVIGPGDYFGLGWIKRRKWTWILFPAVTIGFAVAVLWLSQWFLGITDNRRALTIVDLGDDGRVVRQNRFELVITGSSRTVTTPVKQAFFTPISHHHFSGSMAWNQMAGVTYATPRGGAGGFNPNQRDATDPGPTQYAGRVPSLYTANQNLPQWTPRLNRQLGILPRDAEVAVDWKAVHRAIPEGSLKDFTTDWQKYDPLRKELGSHFGNGATIYLLHGSDEAIRLPSSNRPPQTPDPNDPFPDNYSEYGPRVQVSKTITGPNGQQQTVTSWEYQGIKSSFIRDLCGVQQPGMFSVVSQISPNGGHSFDDLTLLDPSDDRQWLIVVVVPTGPDHKMVRTSIGNFSHVEIVPNGQDYVMYRKLVVK